MREDTSRARVVRMIGLLGLIIPLLTSASFAKDESMDTIETPHDLGYRTNPYGGGWYDQGGLALADVDHLVVAGSCGEVLLKHTDGSEVEIAVTRVANSHVEWKAHEYLDQVRVRLSREGKTVRVEAVVDANAAPPVAVNYILTLPRETSVSVDVEVGSIKAHRVEADLDLKTMTGSIDLHAVLGNVRAWTETGLITASLDGAEVGPYALETTTGIITLELSRRSKVSLRASTETGMIEASRRLDIDKKDDRHLEARHNGGGTEIELRAQNGAIRITV